jgi:hypothetical protein
VEALAAAARARGRREALLDEAPAQAPHRGEADVEGLGDPPIRPARPARRPVGLRHDPRVPGPAGVPPAARERPPRLPAPLGRRRHAALPHFRILSAVGRLTGRRTHPITADAALAAFSGTVIDPEPAGALFTETAMNDGITERELPERFASDDYQVLIVAETYQTGFDQLLLHTMYVDKRLAGVGGADPLAPEPDRAGQGGHVRPRLRERARGDPGCVRALSRQSAERRGLRPAPP